MKKLRYLIPLLLLIVFLSCSEKYNLKETDVNDNNNKQIENLTDFQKDALAYFKEICLGFEYGNQGEIVRKWENKDTLNLLFEYRSPDIVDEGLLIQPGYYPLTPPSLIDGTPVNLDIRIQRRNELLKSLKKTVDIINTIVKESGFYINVVESDGNLYQGGQYGQFNMPNNRNSISTQKHNGIFVFASRNYFLWRYPNSEQLKLENGNGALWTIMQNNKLNRNRITGCRILCVLDQQGAYDNNLAVLKSFIKEELVQPLGFFRDSEKHPESIFYETANDGGFSTDMSALDKEIMRLMYLPGMKIGMSGIEAQKLIIDTYTEENKLIKK